MNEHIINNIVNNIDKLGGIIVTHNDKHIIDLLVKNLILIQKITLDKIEFSNTDKHLLTLERKTEFLINRYKILYKAEI